MTLKASVRVRRDDFTLDVELTVAAGETVAVLGPNGAGKTTLLRALAGLDEVHGRVSLDDEVFEDTERNIHVPTERRHVGLVFQDHVLFPHLTVLENVAFGLKAQHRPHALERARKWLADAGLAERADALPSALSGGQGQRVALVRALATEPRLLLLDEPLSALDVSVRAEVRRELAKQLKSFAGVRLLVTHDPLEAITLAGYLVILEQGRIVQAGKPEEVTAKPRSRFVADLAGVNLLRGHAHADHVLLDDGTSVAAAGAGAGEVFAVIHPRAVAIYRNRPDGTPRNVWLARVEGVDSQADRARVRLAGAVPLVAEVTSGAVRELGLVSGTEVWVAVKATEVSSYPA
jgi:molybdate transport system ATP-binding protein